MVDQGGVFLKEDRVRWRQEAFIFIQCEGGPELGEEELIPLTADADRVDKGVAVKVLTDEEEDF